MTKTIALLICCAVIGVSGCKQAIKLSCDVGECRILPKLAIEEADDGWTYEEGLLRPEWSPDEKHILFTRMLIKYNEKNEIWHGKNEIWIISSDGTGPKKLTDGDKGCWQSPDVIAYTHYTEENGKIATHYALINVRTAEVTPLKKPAPQKKVQFKWKDKIYSIVDSPESSWHMHGQGRKVFAKEFERTGYHVNYLNVRRGIVFFHRGYSTIDTGYFEDVLQLVSDDISQAKVIVNNGHSPSLSYDGKKMLFIRDHELWIKRLANDLGDTLSP